MKKEVLSSPIRWAGSKKRVLNEMLEFFSKNKKNYIEPFLGSGVVMLNVLNNNDYLKYEKFYVNDINKNIIDFFKLLKEKPRELVYSLLDIANDYNNKSSQEQELMYYEIRTKFNQLSKNKSVYFYFLMKVGYNGVYRENKKGEFNVPFGRKEKFIVNEEYLMSISKLIKKVKFYNMSYEKFIDKMKKENYLDSSFIYCDPPYIPDDDAINQKQELYTNNCFDHIDFSNMMVEINGADIMISMSESSVSKKIYGSKFYQKKLTDILRTINPKKILKSKEIMFLNFKLK